MKLSLSITILSLFTFSVVNGQNVTYKHDKAGRLIQITYPNAKAVNYIYDNDGNRIYHATVLDSALLPHSGIITGSSSICVGATIALSDTASGGIWSASNPTATVSSVGIVNGVSVGVDTISYTVTNSYGTATATKVITINPLPVAGKITGSTNVCASTTLILVDVAAGGVWSASNSLATVSGGIVSAVSAGTTIISYTVTNSCGSAFATKTITINPLPSPGVIVGNTNVCVDATITLSNAVTGGTWSISNPSATITSSGLVIGISAGTNIISYAVGNSCGIAYATYPITIFSADACSSAGISRISNTSLIKIYPNPTNGTFTIEVPDAKSNTTIMIIDVYGQAIETRRIEAKSGLKEIFDFEKVARGTYLIRVRSDDKTYEEKVVIW